MKLSHRVKLVGLGVLAAGLVSLSFGRVGPVSQYGQLMAGKSSVGKGQIYGSCKGVKDGAEVAVQGMSLFWSISSDVGSPFWTAEIVNGLVEKQNIQLIRAAMGVDEDWGSGNYFTKTGYYQGLMNTVVQAAIDNDIYVIIDYHSHKASNNTDNAKSFFSYMAEKWGKYDNVIFEIFNEPLEGVAWGTIKTYANDVVKTIRQHSDNLILVGSRSWDQYPSDAIGSEVEDSKNNVAYAFHFYAGSHSKDGEGASAVKAMNAGLSVFVSEWGTVNADGGGSVSGNSSTWLEWMNTHKLSGANWSVSNKNEGASYFNGSAWNYSESGKWVNSNIFSKLPTSYTACDGAAPASSSSEVSSSSVQLAEGYTDYIDDLEDGDNFAFTGGEWYAYTDVENDGASTLTNAEGKKGGYDVVIAGSKAGNESEYVAGITGIKLDKGNYDYDPFVALGVALNEKQTAYDLSACTEISYKYKGAAHNFKAEDTAVEDFGYHQITKTAAASWTTVRIPWDMLTQEAWADDVTLSKKRINKLTWEVKGKSGQQLAYNYLYVDDVRCSGWSIKPVPSPSSSASEESSSSIESSNSESSSSEVVDVSSSSVQSSSSAKSSSSTVKEVVISGELKQTVAQGGVIMPVMFTNVDKGYRQTQNIYYLSVSKSGDVLVVDGTVPTNASVGKVTENIYVNGEVYTVEITVVEASEVSSSSSEEAKSSSSVVVSSNWEANANLTNGSNGDVVIGSTNDWVSDRVVTKNLGTVTAGESYTLSFEADVQQNTMDMAVSLGANCNDPVALSEASGKATYNCTFTAKETGNAVLTLTMPGSRWEQVTISGLSLKTSSGEEVIAPTSSSTVAGSSSSEKTTFVAASWVNPLSLAVADRTLHVMGVDMAMVDVFDLQGRPVASFKQVKGAVNLGMLRQGNYIVRVRSGSNSLIRRISIK